MGARLVDSAELPGETAGLADALVEMQLRLGHARPLPADPRARSRAGRPEIAERHGREATTRRRSAFARALVELIGRGAMLDTPRGHDRVLRRRRAAAGRPRSRDVRPLGVEQSNTLDRDRRRADREALPPHRAGREPRARDAALLRHARLRPRAGAVGLVVVRGRALLAARWGWCSGSSPAPSTAGRSRSRSSRPTRRRSSARTRRLGEVIGGMHAVLASEPDDPAFAPETASPESLGAAHGQRRRADRRGLRAPARERRDARRSSAGATRCASLLRDLSTVGSVGQAHPPSRRPPPRADALGRRRLDRDRLRGRARAPAAGAAAQALAAARRRRDAALVHATRSRRRRASRTTSVEEQARASFLDGYLDAVERADLLPPRDTTERLLRIYELEKVVYELRYELANRPDWVSVPVAGILRLLEQAET